MKQRLKLHIGLRLMSTCRIELSITKHYPDTFWSRQDHHLQLLRQGEAWIKGRWIILAHPGIRWSRSSSNTNTWKRRRRQWLKSYIRSTSWRTIGKGRKRRSDLSIFGSMVSSRTTGKYVNKLLMAETLSPIPNCNRIKKCSLRNNLTSLIWKGSSIPDR